MLPDIFTLPMRNNFLNSNDEHLSKSATYSHIHHTGYGNKQ